MSKSDNMGAVSGRYLGRDGESTPTGVDFPSGVKGALRTRVVPVHEQTAGHTQGRHTRVWRCQGRGRTRWPINGTFQGAQQTVVAIWLDLQRGGRQAVGSNVPEPEPVGSLLSPGLKSSCHQVWCQTGVSDPERKVNILLLGQRVMGRH